jgi:hypothetical protein
VLYVQTYQHVIARGKRGWGVASPHFLRILYSTTPSLQHGKLLSDTVHRPVPPTRDPPPLRTATNHHDPINVSFVLFFFSFFFRTTYGPTSPALRDVIPFLPPNLSHLLCRAREKATYVIIYPLSMFFFCFLGWMDGWLVGGRVYCILRENEIVGG